MKDLKTRLFWSVICGRKPDPIYFDCNPQRSISFGGIVSTALAVVAAAGLLMLLFQKLKPFL